MIGGERSETVECLVALKGGAVIAADVREGFKGAQGTLRGSGGDQGEQFVERKFELAGDLWDRQIGLDEQGEGAVDQFAIGAAGLRGVRM